MKYHPQLAEVVLQQLQRLYCRPHKALATPNHNPPLHSCSPIWAAKDKRFMWLSGILHCLTWPEFLNSRLFEAPTYPEIQKTWSCTKAYMSARLECHGSNEELSKAKKEKKTRKTVSPEQTNICLLYLWCLTSLLTYASLKQNFTIEPEGSSPAIHNRGPSIDSHIKESTWTTTTTKSCCHD